MLVVFPLHRHLCVPLLMLCVIQNGFLLTTHAHPQWQPYIAVLLTELALQLSVRVWVSMVEIFLVFLMTNEWTAKNAVIQKVHTYPIIMDNGWPLCVLNEWGDGPALNRHCEPTRAIFVCATFYTLWSGPILMASNEMCRVHVYTHELSSTVRVMPTDKFRWDIFAAHVLFLHVEFFALHLGWPTLSAYNIFMCRRRKNGARLNNKRNINWKRDWNIFMLE